MPIDVTPLAAFIVTYDAPLALGGAVLILIGTILAGLILQSRQSDDDGSPPPP